ncbi:hypothetical protein ZIOFF_028791 [Zingiber officinale]|uniref:Uncharacterized protein n=1 Tax=Zingiber officinale TaxID=94328 RepID=A0A8J5GNG7_ZINOF|nr:hypothetical protein ZIOFF_028791 [Zingiber officinale]
MIRIHALHRRNAGTNALIVLRDTRWADDRSIIGTMEVDLSEGTQLVYIAPNLLISVEDFYHHIEIAIQTHGYEQWNSAESNLLITRGLIGRLTNTSHAGFRYNIQNVADYLASTGINAVPATPRTTAELQGMRWILQPPNTPQLRNPQSVRTTTLLDGSISLAFSGYQSTGNPRPSNYNKDDVEDIHEEEFASVFLNSQYDTEEEEEELQHTRQKKNRDKFSQGRWDTLGEPSGKYDYLVRYDIPSNFFETEMPPPTGWEDEIISEVVLPSIWEDTPWEDDPEFDPNDLAEEEGSDVNELGENQEEEEEDPESYYLGLQNQELDYPLLAPPNQDSQEDEEYWQQVVQHVEQIEAQLPTENGWHNPVPLDYSLEEFIDRIHEGMAEGNWYEIYENSEQTENEIYNVPKQISNEVTNLSDNISVLNLQQEHVQENEVAHVTAEHLEYPMFRQLEKALASTSDSAISNYRQPNEPLMGQINYPPAQGTTPQFNDNGQFKGRFKGKALEHNTWVLPSAQQNTGVMLVLPEDISQYHDVISRWESITNNLVNDRTWLDNKQKVQFIENLLGENEKKNVDTMENDVCPGI